MSETYTLDDLKESQGEIKQELRSDVQRVAKQGGDVWEKFIEVCEEDGVDPVTRLVDMVFMVLQDESYADRVKESEIGVNEARSAEARKGDMEYVLDLYEEYDIFGGDDGDDISVDINSLVEERLKATAGGPLDGGFGGGGGGGSNLERKLDSLHDRIDEMERKMQQEGGSQAEAEMVEADRSSSGSGSTEEELDEILETGEGGGGEEPTEAEAEEAHYRGEAEEIYYDGSQADEANPLNTEGEDSNE